MTTVIEPQDLVTPPSYCEYAGGPCDQTFTGAFAPEALFLYGSQPQTIASIIEAAVTRHNGEADGAWKTWRDLPIAGQIIFCEISKAMRFSKLLVADVTTLNFNLMFEIGYTIGLGKPVVPIRDTSLVTDKALFNDLGMLDTLGYVDFVNSTELEAQIAKLSPEPLHPINRAIDLNTPVYVAKSPYDTDGQIQLMASIKKSALKFRAYDPKEVRRLSLHDARAEVAQSVGVITHLVDPQREGAQVHNARCALLAGLAMAQQKVVLMLQETVVPQPIDYRDVVRAYIRAEDIPSLLDRPVRVIVDRLQSNDARTPRPTTDNLLENVDLGEVAAENEITALESYFVPTGQANLARQGRARLVVGRKGSGKTAIFYRVREDVFRRRTHLVLDLKPEGHQFKQLRDTIEDRLGEGLAEHTMVAFWNYIFLAELARKIIDDWSHARTDPDRLEAYTRVEEVYKRHNPGFEADFSQRLLWEANRLAEALGGIPIEDVGPKLTELIFTGDVRELNEAVTDYLIEKEAVWLLIDNLDKGWPIRGSTPMDILIVRGLLEASRKIQRQLEDRGIEFRCLVFLRTDIHEHLVSLTPDKGKDTAIRLDWEDPELLGRVIAERIHTSTGLEGAARELWNEMCVSHVNAEDTFNYVIDRTLMRPRDLLLFVRKLIQVALNRGHSKIQTEDIPQAEQQYSEDMLLTTGYEIADTHPETAEALYAFHGARGRLSSADVVGLLLSAGIADDALDDAISLLLWFGFLGVQSKGELLYAHTAQFNITRLRMLADGHGSFVVHPAFRAALAIDA